MSFQPAFEAHPWDDTKRSIYAKTTTDVEQALRASKRTLEDFKALISPAAAPYLEQMAQLSNQLTLKRFGNTITIEPEALEKIVTEGYSLAYGARFLKRVIDDRLKLPLSQRWKEANSFRATVADDQVAIETVGPRLVASTDPDAIAV